MKRGAEPKTQLTPDEKLRCAFGHLCLGIAKHDLSALYGINPGRVSEAVDGVAKATGHKSEIETKS